VTEGNRSDMPFQCRHRRLSDGYNMNDRGTCPASRYACSKRDAESFLADGKLKGSASIGQLELQKEPVGEMVA